MKEIIMPQFGETVEEDIFVSKWHKAVGDEVKMGDVLMTIETGKSELEVESAYDGKIVDILVNEGESTLPLTVVGHLES